MDVTTIHSAGTTALPELSRKRERDRLLIRREPYWQRLSKGAALGFRRGPDTWVERFRDREGKHQYESFGESLEFHEAKRRAGWWLAQLAGGEGGALPVDCLEARPPVAQQSSEA